MVVVGYWLLVVGYWLLVIGYWLLVIGYWLLVVGCWLLVVGYWLLVIGCWSIPSPASIVFADDRTFEANRHRAIRCDRLVLCETRLNYHKTLRNHVVLGAIERGISPVAREKVVNGSRPYIPQLKQQLTKIDNICHT